MNNEIKELLKKIPPYVPVISAVFIYLGYRDLKTYYGHYGIKVLDYISFSELLIHSFDIIFPSLIYLSLAWAVVALTIKGYTLIAERNERLASFLTKTSIFVFGFGVIALYFFKDDINSFWIPFFDIITFIASIGVYKVGNPNWSSNRMRNIVVTFYVTICYTSFVSDLISIRYEKAETLSATKESTFYFTNATLRTSSTLIYIGKTEGFMFFWDKTNKTNIIYNMSEFKYNVVQN